LFAEVTTEEFAKLLAGAALALQNVANICDTPEKKKHLREVVQQALVKVKAFAGPPDQGTIEVLEMLLSGLPQK
jgi:hypothetical protein